MDQEFMTSKKVDFCLQNWLPCWLGISHSDVKQATSIASIHFPCHPFSMSSIFHVIHFPCPRELRGKTDSVFLSASRSKHPHRHLDLRDSILPNSIQFYRMLFNPTQFYPVLWLRPLPIFEESAFCFCWWFGDLLPWISCSQQGLLRQSFHEVRGWFECDRHKT